MCSFTGRPPSKYGGPRIINLWKYDHWNRCPLVVRPLVRVQVDHLSTCPLPWLGRRFSQFSPRRDFWTRFGWNYQCKWPTLLWQKLQMAFQVKAFLPAGEEEGKEVTAADLKVPKAPWILFLNSEKDGVSQHIYYVSYPETKWMFTQGTVQSPQFQQAVSMFSMALQSGQIAPLVNYYRVVYVDWFRPQKCDYNIICTDAVCTRSVSLVLGMRPWLQQLRATWWDFQVFEP